MPGIEQIKISLPSKILRVKVDFCRGPPRHGAGAPLHLHQQGLGGPREATSSRVFSPSQRFGLYKYTQIFLEAVMTYFFKPYFYHSIAV